MNYDSNNKHETTKTNYIEKSINWGRNAIVFEKNGDDYAITNIK